MRASANCKRIDVIHIFNSLLIQTPLLCICHTTLVSSRRGFSLPIMGGVHSKRKKKGSCKKRDIHVWSLTEKIRLLKEEINEMMDEREKERRGYEREVMVFAFKEAEWKQERKKLREEVKRLRKSLEEKEEKIRVMEKEDEDGDEKKSCQLKEWELLGTTFLVEQMREERARRDEAVEKWKQLYLAIKTELDDLIQRTHNGDVMYWRAEEEGMIQELRMEVKDKEQSIKALKAQLGTTEQEVYRRERDIDILRQSLKITSCKKKPSRVGKKSFCSRLHLSKQTQ